MVVNSVNEEDIIIAPDLIRLTYMVAASSMFDKYFQNSTAEYYKIVIQSFHFCNNQ